MSGAYGASPVQGPNSCELRQLQDAAWGCPIAGRLLCSNACVIEAMTCHMLSFQVSAMTGPCLTAGGRGALLVSHTGMHSFARYPVKLPLADGMAGRSHLYVWQRAVQEPDAMLELARREHCLSAHRHCAAIHSAQNLVLCTEEICCKKGGRRCELWLQAASSTCPPSMRCYCGQ